MPRLVALLRGINLARTRRVAMADLRALLAAAGYADVRTHLQSGNVIVSTDRAPDEAARDLEARIAERFGFDVDVLVRTAEELADVVAANPLGEVATDGSRHFVAFLSGEPDAAAVAEIAARDFGSERFTARGREIYVWCPEGLRDCGVMKAIGDRRLAVATATVRNWNTVTKLLELAAAPG
jgi:uncharacterized protein (DUF1697 family)